MASLKRQTEVEGLNERSTEILHLLAEGLSNREIAERLVMTINTVKWYNRQIYSILDVGSRTQAIARARDLQLLNGDDEPEATSRTIPSIPKHNLPPETTRFIGRKHEIASIRQALENTRLLTLVGPPGTGKTRLSLRVAHEVTPDFRDGVYFVSLAPISDPTLVTHAIASASGINEQYGQPLSDTLKNALRDLQMLLIVDNFEHLLPAAPQISELLAAAPQLKVLATSREPLHLYGEQEYAVPPLALPNPEQNDPQALANCESTALFVQKARAVRSGFELTHSNAIEIAQICIRLEGMPLAIELAAARSKLLTPRALLARLNSRLETLTGGAHDAPARQQTLRNTIEWSYNLLNEGEKILFARLAVFRGGCSLEAIEAVCRQGLPMNVFDGLESLVNKSLIQQKELPEGDPRFDMLETLHEYAGECMEASGEAESVRRLYAEFMAQLAEQAEPELRQAQQQRWFKLLETEHENMHAVLKWSLDNGDATLGARLCSALVLFWFATGDHTEGRQWTEKLLARRGSVPERYHARMFIAAGHMTMLYDLETARRYFEQALRLSREQKQPVVTTAWALIFLGYSMMNEMEAAYTTVEEGLALFRELQHKPGTAQALNIIGELARVAGDDARAKDAYEECLLIAQETGEKRRIRFMLGNLSFLAQHEGDYARARPLAERAVRMAIEVDNALDIAEDMAGLAGVIGATGHPEKAARLMGAWDAALERLHAVPQPANRPENERNLAAIHAQLDPATFEVLWAEGRAMSLEQAVAFALEAGEP